MLESIIMKPFRLLLLALALVLSSTACQKEKIEEKLLGSRWSAVAYTGTDQEGSDKLFKNDVNLYFLNDGVCVLHTNIHLFGTLLGGTVPYPYGLTSSGEYTVEPESASSWTVTLTVSGEARTQLKGTFDLSKKVMILEETLKDGYFAISDPLVFTCG